MAYCCFFFKQKTAYEMRISDWSSDVCSSDLEGRQIRRGVALISRALFDQLHIEPAGLLLHLADQRGEFGGRVLDRLDPLVARVDEHRDGARETVSRHQRGIGVAGRSEEHTSELQSLMRISYAVFCLKKKKK